MPVGTTTTTKSCKQKNKHMGGGIQAFVDYFEIVPGSNLVTEYLDCMTLTNPAERRACSVSVHQPSSLQRSAAAAAARRGGGTLG